VQKRHGVTQLRCYVIQVRHPSRATRKTPFPQQTLLSFCCGKDFGLAAG
jgi:hypothetical protein